MTLLAPLRVVSATAIENGGGMNMSYNSYVAVEDWILDDLRIKDDDLVEALYTGSHGELFDVAAAWMDVQELLHSAGLSTAAVDGEEIIVGDPMVGIVAPQRVEKVLSDLSSVDSSAVQEAGLGEAIRSFTDFYEGARSSGLGVVVLAGE
ncbi:Hypothetical protein CulFRC11_0381 [Corynebacterium ramonii]|uniref:Uncharacterized protein n=2 Tax=Corynebacteriaceae TaxID=1653 RepID=A0ABN4EE46_9CORY|nr:Hypothetical protein CulFRC11_0381 [Corynebacterium ramonii FRC0011]AKA95932.1 Hypothetical protein CUL131002_0384 [Corynebacterium ulcerans]ESU58758.1 hypothetical protein D881_02635 [Corynebacterium ulcerans NCTC 12077]